MFEERDREEAIKAFIKGRRVIVITEFITGGVGAQALEELLPEDGVHYLVDVPAIVNPEFEQAVQEMAEQDEDAEGTTPRRSRKSGWKKKR